MGLFSCNQCSRQYMSYSAYLRHEKSHDRNRWHYCETCNLSFSRVDVLRRHEQIHSNTNRNGDRQRSVRACDGRRSNKVRCNGARPCHHCLQGGKKCSYLMKSSRPSAQGFAENSPDATYDPFVAEGGIPPAQGTPLLSPSTRSK